MSIPTTRTAEHRATDPAGSAWVSANAGSGKTYVLTRRVIRLLLSGCDPARILCLTFTKAAAAEMANRVFGRLGEWTTMPDPKLAAAIVDIEGEPPTAQRIAAARRLFAEALETPGGLKIQTIHGFCEALLQRFPIEADLPGRFEVLDDRQGLVLKAEARARAIREAVGDAEGKLGSSLALLLARTPDQRVDAVIDGFLNRREDFLAFVSPHGSLEAALAGLPAILGVPAGMSREDLLADCSRSPVFAGPDLSRLIDVLDGDKPSMRALADCFRDALAETDPARRAAAWCRIFLTEGRPRAANVVTNGVEALLPGARDRFHAEALRIIDVEQAIAACDTAAMTAAAARIADRVIGHYQALKRAAGALDFDDLIQRTVALLSRSDAAAWVQYKLDEGLDHVLVDEAQDTSPLQWQIVKALTGDFFAGHGARGRSARTVFAVGDEKQSIYSFQGAAPRHFAENGVRFAADAKAAAADFHAITLNISYRSTPDVVKAVDCVFRPPAAHAGLSRDLAAPVHETNRIADPGHVEVWPEIEAAETPKPERWEDPVDRSGPGSPDVRLATRIANEVAGWLTREERLEATGKRIRPGDILVLVRKRGPFVEAVNRALKERGIPIAGADRLDVLGHIVAMDLVAAARVALLPEDDLTLAAFARSPLVPPSVTGECGGLTDEALFAIAHGRTGSLWDAVQAAAGAGDRQAERLRARVETLLVRVGDGEPFRFFAAIVGEDGGRAAFRARIGREADEVIDEFLSLAMAAEERGAASLAGFLAMVQASTQDVRREVDTVRDEVRVMTVHGAKGLEAPVVFLVDPGSPPSSTRHDPVVMKLGEAPGAPLVWVQPGTRPAVVDAALADYRSAAEAEYRRLLYVGLTRAADRLIVAGVKSRRARPEGRWHTLVAEALGPDSKEIRDENGAVERWIWRLDDGRTPKPAAADDRPPAAPEPLPRFLTTRPAAPALPRGLTPSTAAALVDDNRHATAAVSAPPRDPLARARGLETMAIRRGNLVHRLLEVLPEVTPDRRRAAADAHLARIAADIDEAARTEMVHSVAAIIEDPRFAAVFGPGGRAEVSVAGTIASPDGREVPVHGQVDRLLVSSEEILIVDYKTGLDVPAAVPPAYVAQLALYRALMMRLRPGVPVRAAILWTSIPRLDEVAPAEMDAIVQQLLTNLGPAGPEPRP